VPAQELAPGVDVDDRIVKGAAARERIILVDTHCHVDACRAGSLAQAIRCGAGHRHRIFQELGIQRVKQRFFLPAAQTTPNPDKPE